MWIHFEKEEFEQFADQFVSSNDIQFRKIEGVSYIGRKKDWDYIGGNDSKTFRVAWTEDFDCHCRMICEGYNFVVTSKALVQHFGSRTSNFYSDDLSKISGRKRWESINMQAFFNKWGEYPTFDEVGFSKVSHQMKDRYFKHIKGKY